MRTFTVVCRLRYSLLRGCMSDIGVPSTDGCTARRPARATVLLGHYGHAVDDKTGSRARFYGDDRQLTA